MTRIAHLTAADYAAEVIWPPAMAIVLYDADQRQIAFGTLVKKPSFSPSRALLGGLSWLNASVLN